MSEEMAEGVASHIMSESDYNPVEAKFCASLFWLVFHATEDGDFDDIPPEITCPTERNEQGGFTARPSVKSFLSSGGIYTKVCYQVLKSEREISSLWDVIQELSNAGFYVIDANDKAVTEERLVGQEPFDVESHLALMDALIVAFINQSVNIQQVVDAVRRFATFNPAKELPFDYEDAFLLWLNKINTTNNVNIGKKKQAEKNESPRRFRFKRDQVIETRTPKFFPKLDDLQRDLSDGRSLLSLILFYCPNFLELEHIKLSGSLTDEDIISNVDLFRELCAQHICTSIFALRTEDFIYKYPELKNNLIALFCEIFITVESERNQSQTENEVLYGEDWQTKDSTVVVKPPKGRVRIEENGDSESFPDDFDAGSKDMPLNGQIEVDVHDRYGENEDRENIVNHRDDAVTLVRPNKARESSEEVDWKTGVHAREKGNFIDQVDLSIEDELQRLKLLSGGSKANESLDSLPPKPGVSSANKAARTRQPLLSKRSKKQLANFDDGERCLSNEDLPALELDDFDLKRSHSMSSVVERANYVIDPKRSIRAWEGGKSSPDVTRSKSSKISLDFKPDLAPYRSLKTSESYTIENHTPHSETLSLQSSSSIAERSIDDFELCNNQHQKPPKFLKSQEKIAKNNLEASLDFQSSRYIDLHNGNKSFGYEAAIDDVRESAGSTSSEDMRKFRDKIKEKLNIEKNEHVNLEPEFFEPQLEDDDMFGFGDSANRFASFKKPPLPLNYGISPRPNKIIESNTRSHIATFKTKDDDDELSTIAESSEPSTPTIYSFDSESRNSTLNTSDEITPNMQSNEAESTLTSRNCDFQTGFMERNPNISANFNKKSQIVVPQTDLRSTFTIEEPTEETNAQAEPNPENYRFSSEHGSDLEDAAVDLRVGSRSSSSGISADEPRDEVISEGDDERPSIAVYSSLSEHTAGGSPTNFDAKTNEEGNHVETVVTDDGDYDEGNNITPVQLKGNNTEKGLEDDTNGGKNSVSGVKRRTYLSLDYDEEEQTSTSALAVCIEPVGNSEDENVNSSGGKSRHNWSYMEVEVKDENPSRILDKSDKNTKVDQETTASTPLFGKQGNSKDREMKKKHNTTTSWNEISREDGSDFWKSLKNPEKAQNHCLTHKIVEGPVMNWAEYAKLKNLENAASGSEGKRKYFFRFFSFNFR